MFTQTAESIDMLRQQAAGSVLTPDDPAYETTRRGWNRSIDHHPALIVVPTHADDVVAAVRYAREAGLGVAIQTTGHGLHIPADDNLLIVTDQMNAVQVDPAARTARIEGGAKWKPVIEAAAPHGLAPLNGSSPYVGVVGYTLGGGIGWMVRRFGLAADSVRWIEIVTADGVLRRASPTENSDLFWGLRGGGGNFGVVTALEIDLYPVPTVYGGFVAYSGNDAREALRFFRDWVKTAPDELTSSFQLMKFPNVPMIPEPMRGQVMVFMRAVYAGNSIEGEAAIRPWLEWKTPNMNTFRELPYAQIGDVSQDPVDPVASYASNALFDELSDDAIDTFVRRATDSASPVMMNELRHVGGGAVERAASDANAVGNRDAQFYYQLGGMSPTPEAKEALKNGIHQMLDALKPYTRAGGYLNFMSGGEAKDRAKEAYLPESFARLKALKAQYDPDNLFRFSYQLV